MTTYLTYYEDSDYSLRYLEIREGLDSMSSSSRISSRFKSSLPFLSVVFFSFSS